MPSELYNSLGNVPINQDPKSAAINRMHELGIPVPERMQNDPNALIQYVMQKGIPQSRLGMAQQAMQRMFGR